MPVAVSTAIVRTDPLETALQRIARAGFSAVEVSYASLHLEVIRHSESRKGVSRWLRALGLRATSVHMPHSGLDITGLDEELRQRSIRETVLCLEACAGLECSVAILHPNGYTRCDDEHECQERQVRMMRSLDELLPVAERLGISLALENMLRYEGRRFGCNHSELRPLVDEFDHRHLGLCVDTTHALMCGLDPAEQLRIAGPRLIATHLSDDDGRSHGHWIPGEGTVNWPACWGALREIDYTGTRTFEVYGQQGRPELVRELGDFAKRMQSAPGLEGPQVTGRVPS